MEISVRKLFWDALEIALETQTHRLAKDIATVLGESDAPLLKALREEKVKVRLFEEAADEEVEDLADYRCKHWSAHGPFWRMCCEPVLWRSGAALKQCLYHTLHPCPNPEGPSVHELITEDGDSLYVNKETKAVYSETGVLCGRLSEEGGTVELFEIC